MPPTSNKQSRKKVLAPELAADAEPTARLQRYAPGADEKDPD